MPECRFAIFFSFLALLVFNGCIGGPRCIGDDKQLGAINSQPLISCQPSAGEEFVIAHDSIYRKLFPGCQLPHIDFSSETLIGLYTTSTGCDNKVKREVRVDNEHKEYLYTVTITECGLCKPLYMDYNWVTVPRLPEGWVVRFERKKK
jgi:hypothetical protein